MNKLLLIFSFAIQLSVAQAQSIKGIVVDEKKEPLINATIQVYKNDTLKGGVITDFDGKYNIGRLPRGYYNMLVTYAGYDSSLTTNILVTDNTLTIQNVQLKKRQHGIICYFPVRAYKKPLVDQDNPSKTTFTREEINHMPH